MSTIKHFEEIEAWKEARLLAANIYRISNTGAFKRDFPLRDQIRKAAISVMSNIAEGFERDGRREFIQFLALAKGSSGEVRAQLYVALDQIYISREEFTSLADQTKQINRLLAGLMNYLRKAEVEGLKFRPARP
jgi:four helix bundle protein